MTLKERLLKVVGSFAVNFKSHRKKIGGDWFLIADQTTAGGMQSGFTYWSQHRPVEDETIWVVKEEHW